MNDCEFMEIDVGRWVRQARELAEKSQEQLALDLGYKGKGTVSAWEKNTNAVPFDKMLEKSKITGAPLPYILPFSGAVRRARRPLGRGHLEPTHGIGTGFSG